MRAMAARLPDDADILAAFDARSRRPMHVNDVAMALGLAPTVRHVLTETLDAMASRLAGADVVLFDGTLFSDDEMIAAGAGVKTGRRALGKPFITVVLGQAGCDLERYALSSRIHLANDLHQILRRHCLQ